MSVTSFVETIKPKNDAKLIVYLDSKVYPKEFGVSIRPLHVIDVQIAKLPEEVLNNKEKDFIFSKGWNGIKSFVLQSNDNNVNGRIILRANKSVKNGKKDFPHEKNTYL